MKLPRSLSAALLALSFFVSFSCASGQPPYPGTPTPPTAPASSPAPASAPAKAAVYPAAEWEKIADPSTAGWSQATLDEVRAELSKLDTTAFMAIAGGRVLMEYGDVTIVSYLASVRKSVLSMLFGNYVASGKVRLNKSLAEIGIDDIGRLTAEEKQATIKDLITARSGIYHPASNSGDDLGSAPPRGIPAARHVLTSTATGTSTRSAPCSRHETGRDIYDALESDLVKPIGMQDFDRASHRRTGDCQGPLHLAYHMNFSTRDMARIGYLMLREGNWNGRQVVPADWVRESTRAFTPVTEMNPSAGVKGRSGTAISGGSGTVRMRQDPIAGAYTGLGAVGQHITVLPALDLVVVHKTQPGGQRGVSHQQYTKVLDILVKGHK